MAQPNTIKIKREPLTRCRSEFAVNNEMFHLTSYTAYDDILFEYIKHNTVDSTGILIPNSKLAYRYTIKLKNGMTLIMRFCDSDKNDYVCELEQLGDITANPPVRLTYGAGGGHPITKRLLELYQTY